MCVCFRYLGVSGVSEHSLLYQQHPTVGPRSAEPEDPLGPSAEAKAVCSSLPGVAAQQVDVCLQQPTVMQAVASGAARGIGECQHQFRHERWNCSTQNDENQLFGTTLDRGKKLMNLNCFLNILNSNFDVLINANDSILSLRLSLENQLTLIKTQIERQKHKESFFVYWSFRNLRNLKNL